MLSFNISCSGDISGELGSGSSLPIMGSVSDGTAYNSLTNSPTITWSAGASSASMSSYELAIGTTAGDSDVYSWTSMGALTSTSISGLALAHGNTYYVSVKGLANGEESAVLSSDGWMVDNVSPGAASSIDDGVFQVNTAQTNMITWAAATDADSGVSYYEMSISTVAGTADTVGWTNIGNVTSYQFTGMSFVSGTTYYVSIQAVDEAGNTGAVLHSDGFIAGEYCSDKAAWLTYNASGNAGTPADPFEICNAAQLEDIGIQAAALSASYILMGDIDFAPYYAAPNAEFQIGDCDPSGCASWQGANVFSGDFDGNGKTLSNFSFVSPATVGSSFIASLDNATVRDLTMTGAVISGAANTGVLSAGTGGTRIENVHVSGTITSAGDNSGGLSGGMSFSVVDRSSANVNIASTGRWVAGLVGSTYHTAVVNSFSSGTLSADSYHGGLIGNASHTTVSTSYSSASVTASGGNSITGGLVGRAEYYSRISNSYSTGDVNGNHNLGGFTGVLDSFARVKNSYSTGDVVSTGTGVGGLVGNMSSAGTYIEKSYSTGDVNSTGGSLADTGYVVGIQLGSVANSYYLSASTCDSTGAGGACNTTSVSSHGALSDFYSPGNAPMSFWDCTATTANGTDDYWTFAGVDHANLWFESSYSFTAPFSGDGTSGSPYLITSKADWNLVGQNPRWMNSYFSLITSLDFLASSFDQIGGDGAPFTGTFAGNSNTVSNVTNAAAGEDFVGVFGIVGPMASVSDITASNVNISGRDFVGGMIALQDSSSMPNAELHVSSGTVTSTGQIAGGVIGANFKHTLSRFSSSANVNGVDRVGGAIGYTQYGNNSNFFAKGAVTGTDEVGGLIGENESNMQRAYAQGNVTALGEHIGGLIGLKVGSSVSECYSTGSVSGVGSVGGLVGESTGGNIDDCFSAAATVDGQNGVTEVGLFLGFDGGTTLNNDYYWSGASCDSTGAAGACNAFANPDATLSNFYNSSKAPLSSWWFPGDWLTTATFPKLSWEP